MDGAHEKSLAAQETAITVTEPTPKPEKAHTMEERISAMEDQLLRQNDLIRRQNLLLERQERRALYAKIWLGVKIAIVVILVIWLAPKAYAAWIQYQTLIAQMNSFMEQIDTFVTDVQGFTGDVESFITDARTQVDALSETLTALQNSFAPLTSFLSRFG